jgi:hypothetical protein
MQALSTSGSFSFAQTVWRSAGRVTSPFIVMAIVKFLSLRRSRAIREAFRPPEPKNTNLMADIAVWRVGPKVTY